MRKSGNRQFADLRPVETLPPARQIAQVLVIEPADLIAGKVIATHQRRGKPKAGTAWRDLAMLLLRFPELKRDPGSVRDCLLAAGAGPTVLDVWREIVAQARGIHGGRVPHNQSGGSPYEPVQFCTAPLHQATSSAP